MLHNNFPTSFATSSKDGLMSSEDKELLQSLQKRIDINNTDVDNLIGLQEELKGDIESHKGNTSNPHKITKAQVGLGNVDNTSDLNKPISTATENRVKGVEASLTSHISNISNPHSITKDQIGLDKVDNTSDLEKPVSTATETRVKVVESSLSSHSSNKSNPHKVTKEQLELGNVDNTSDLSKPVSDATENRIQGVESIANLALQTADNISKTYLKTSGGTMEGSIDMNGKKIINLSGSYTADASTRFSSAGLQIRENDLIADGQLTIGYAPTIGFHWANVIAATLAMDREGRFNFIDKSGSGYAPLRCGALSAVTANFSDTVTCNDIDAAGIKLTSRNLHSGITFQNNTNPSRIYESNYGTLSINSNLFSSTLVKISNDAQVTKTVPGTDYCYDGSEKSGILIIPPATASLKYYPIISTRSSAGYWDIGTSAGNLYISHINAIDKLKLVDTFSAMTRFTPEGNILATGAITGSKAYSIEGNDYAEWFEKEDLNEEFEPGDILVWKENGVTKSTSYGDNMVVGIYSDTYSHIIGGEAFDDMEENHIKFASVALTGRIPVKVIGKVKRGDFIISSDISGVGIAKNKCRFSPGTAIGKALENKDTDGISKIIISIALF